MKRIASICFIGLLMICNANGQMWTSMNGPQHSSPAQDVTVGKGGSQKVYGITDTAVCYSTDAGVTWSTTGEQKSSMTVGACKPDDQDLVLVAKSVDLYRTTNGGSTFVSVLSRSVMVPNRLRFSTANSSLAFLTADRVSPNNTQSSLWRTTNAGSSWDSIHYFKASVNVDLTDITFKPGDENKIWVAATYNGSAGGGEGIYYSSDKGANWGVWVSNSGLGTNPTVYAVAYTTDGSTPGLIAALKYGTSSTKIYTMAETGGSWTLRQTLTSVVRTMNVNRPSGRDSIVVATNEGIYISTNIGLNWTQRNTGLTDLDCRMAVCDRINTNHIYVATPTGIFKSTNFGESWTRYTPYLVIDPSSSASPRNGVVVSVTQSLSLAGKFDGTNWDGSTQIAQDFHGYYAAIRNQDGNYALVCGSEGTTNTDAVIYNTTNGGATWTKERDIAITGNAIFHQIGVDPNPSSQRVYAVGKTGSGSTAKNFWWSTNKGVTWSSTNGSTIRSSGGADTSICLAIDVSSADADGEANTIYVGLRQVGGYKSLDEGTTWNSMNDIGSGKSVNSFALNSSTTTLAQTVYAGLDQGFWKSTNNGTNWTQNTSYFSNSDIVKIILMDPQGPTSKDSLFLVARRSGAPRDSVYRSINGGSSWTNLTENIPATVSDLRSDPSNSAVIYAATSSGVYKLQVPASPALSSPSNNSNTEVACPAPTLSWSSVSNAISYRLQISTDPTFVSTNVNIVQSGTTYLFTSANCNTKYYWRVAAINVWQGAWSSPVWNFSTNGLPSTIPTLSSPSNDATDATICPTVAWTTDNCARSYQVQVSTDTTNPAATFYDSTKTTTSDAIEGPLNCSQAYYWRVRTKNNCNAGGTWTPYWKFTTKCPEARQIAPSNNSTNITWCAPRTFSWNPFNGGSTKYHLQIDTSTLFNSPKLVDTTKAGLFIDIPTGKLSCGLTYYWRVRAEACAASGTYGPWPPTNYVFTMAPCTPSITLTYPYNGQTSLGYCPSAPVLHWTSTSCTDSFRIQIDTISNFSSIPLLKDTIQENITSYAISLTLLANKTYYWRVSGKSINGFGSWSSTFSFATGSGPTPGTPTLATPCALIWNVVPDASVYYVEVSKFSNFTPIAGSVTTADTTAAINGLENNTTYYVHVRSSNCSGTSAFSASCTFTTATPSTRMGDFVEEEIADSEILEKPMSFALSQNFPNPFNPTTRFKYALPVEGHVTLKIYDVIGRTVAILVDEFQTVGYKEVEFNADALPSGVYFYRLNAGTFSNIKKMLLVK